MLEPIHAVNCERCGYAYDLVRESHCRNPLCDANTSADPDAIRISKERHAKKMAEDAENARIWAIRAKTRSETPNQKPEN